MRVVISDLHGTLLHGQTYSYNAALPAIESLKERNIPLVLCSSKTHLEMECWRERLKTEAPFIVENGGAIYIPRNYFPFRLKNVERRDGYDVIELGAPYRELVAVLQSASRESGCQTLGFHQMSVAE